jgi:hypothetical protein
MKIRNENTDGAILGELGERLAQARLMRNLTQEDFAMANGLSKRTVERMGGRGLGSAFKPNSRTARFGIAGKPRSTHSGSWPQSAGPIEAQEKRAPPCFFPARGGAGAQRLDVG